MIAHVRVEPAGAEFGIRRGQTVFQAAEDAGIDWPTVCFGQARCTACALTMLAGHRNAGPVGQEEAGVLAQMASRKRRTTLRDVRLACRLTVSGDVVVAKRGAVMRPAQPTKESDG